MKSVVARDISSLILKPIHGAAAAPAAGTHTRFDDGPKKSDKAKDAEKADAINHGRYYGLITLNQITLSKKDAEVAGRLVELYFEVFREVLGEGKQEEEEVAEGGEMAEQVEKVAGKVEKWREGVRGLYPRVAGRLLCKVNSLSRLPRLDWSPLS